MTYDSSLSRLKSGWKNRLGLIAISAACVAFGTFSKVKAVQAAPSDQLSVLTKEFNTVLEERVNSLNTNPDIHVVLLDVNTLFASVLPGMLTETVLPCVQGPPLAPASAPTSICVDPDEYLFFDEVHPTAFVHGIIGEKAIESIELGLSDPGGMTELFIFGDSLSDGGNVFGFSGSTFPFPNAVAGPLLGADLYVDGNFTNGGMWWAVVASHFNLINPSSYYQEDIVGNTLSISDGGMSFAVGGATTGTDNAGNAQTPPFPVELPGLQDQIETFTALLESEGLEADPDALYVLWAGPNDFLGAFVPVDPTNPFAPFPDFTTQANRPADNIIAAINELYDLGARNFLVPNMYDMGATPLAADIDILFP